MTHRESQQSGIKTKTIKKLSNHLWFIKGKIQWNHTYRVKSWSIVWKLNTPEEACISLYRTTQKNFYSFASLHKSEIGQQARLHIHHLKEWGKKGIQVHKALVTAGSKMGQMYTALPLCAPRLFPCFESITPRLQRNNLVIAPRPASIWKSENASKKKTNEAP